MNDLLKGAYDLHIHTAPDVVSRKYTDLEVAKHLFDLGMAGFATKSHQFNTVARAAMVQEAYPQIVAVGGVALNRAVGGLNPYAVEMAGRSGGKFVWFPTADSQCSQEYHNAHNHSSGVAKDRAIYTPPVVVFDENGDLLPEVYTILELIKQYDIV